MQERAQDEVIVARASPEIFTLFVFGTTNGGPLSESDGSAAKKKIVMMTQVRRTTIYSVAQSSELSLAV